MRTIKPLVLLSLGASLLLLSGCFSLAKDHRIPNDATVARNYSSVAGDIDVGRRATVQNLDTVAGDIAIGEGSRVRSIESVAGDVHLAEKVTVEKSIETVAGDVDIAAGCVVEGNIETVAGDINLVASVVKGGVILRHGDLKLDRSRIVGVVRVKGAKPREDYQEKDIPKITVGAGSEIGEVIVAAKTLVRLKIHRSAKVGKISGVEAEYFD